MLRLCRHAASRMPSRPDRLGQTEVEGMGCRGAGRQVSAHLGRLALDLCRLVTVRSRQSALADARARGSFQGNTQGGTRARPG